MHNLIPCLAICRRRLIRCVNPGARLADRAPPPPSPRPAAAQQLSDLRSRTSFPPAGTRDTAQRHRETDTPDVALLRVRTVGELFRLRRQNFYEQTDVNSPTRKNLVDYDAFVDWAFNRRVMIAFQFRQDGLDERTDVLRRRSLSTYQPWTDTWRLDVHPHVLRSANGSRAKWACRGVLPPCAANDSFHRLRQAGDIACPRTHRRGFNSLGSQQTLRRPRILFLPNSIPGRPYGENPRPRGKIGAACYL